MSKMATPAETVSIDLALVRRLVSTQFPQWADLPIAPVAFSGWDNRTFHSGEQMTVRLPSAAAYARQVEKEHRWLPILAPLLPLPIPVPLAMGSPAAGYPWPWSVYRWLDGESRETFRAALALDDATWARGRGWALWKALITVAALPGTNAQAASASRRVIDEVLADYGRRSHVTGS